MLWPKKNSYKEFDKEKKFLRIENSLPPPHHLHNFSNGPSLNLMDLSMEGALGCLPFTKSSRKCGCSESRTRLFGSFQLRISESNGTSGKVVLFSRSQCSKRKFEFHFIKAIFQFQAFSSVFR